MKTQGLVAVGELVYHRSAVTEVYDSVRMDDVKKLKEGKVSKYLEEFVVGEKHVTPGRTITETDVVMFAGMTGDYARVHTNENEMKKSQFGTRIAHGLLGLAIAHGLFFRLGLIETSAIAFAQIEEWKFLAPIFFGNTIHCVIEIVDIVPSKSKPDRGIVKFKFEVINEDTGQVAQTGVKSIMMMRKTAI